jgi:hypothetical protein
MKQIIKLCAVHSDRREPSETVEMRRAVVDVPRRGMEDVCSLVFSDSERLANPRIPPRSGRRQGRGDMWSVAPV